MFLFFISFLPLVNRCPFWTPGLAGDSVVKDLLFVTNGFLEVNIFNFLILNLSSLYYRKNFHFKSLIGHDFFKSLICMYKKYMSKNVLTLRTIYIKFISLSSLLKTKEHAACFIFSSVPTKWDLMPRSWFRYCKSFLNKTSSASNVDQSFPANVTKPLEVWNIILKISDCGGWKYLLF